jgi:hypothetical protein
MIWVPHGVLPLPCPQSLDFGPLLEYASSLDLEDEEGEEGVQTQDKVTPAKHTREDDGQVPDKPIPRQHAKRRRQREAARSLDGHLPRLKTIRMHVYPASPLFTSMATEALPASSCGYQAIPGRYSNARRPYDLVELLDGGFHLVEWDGL